MLCVRVCHAHAVLCRVLCHDVLCCVVQGPSSPNAARRGRQRFTSRCHVADVAQAVLADMGRRTTQQQQQQHKGAGSGSTQPTAAVGSCPLIDVINVVDDEPAPRGVVEACAQQLLLRLDTQSTQVEVSSEPTQPVTPQQQQSQAQGQPRQGRRQQEPLEEKRVRNMKLLQLLRDQQQGQHAGLLAPTYREGLRMVLDSPGPFAAEDLDCLFAPLAPAAGK